MLIVQPNIIYKIKIITIIALTLIQLVNFLRWLFVYLLLRIGIFYWIYFLTAIVISSNPRLSPTIDNWSVCRLCFWCWGSAPAGGGLCNAESTNTGAPLPAVHTTALLSALYTSSTVYTTAVVALYITSTVHIIAVVAVYTTSTVYSTPLYHLQQRR